MATAEPTAWLRTANTSSRQAAVSGEDCAPLPVTRRIHPAGPPPAFRACGRAPGATPELCPPLHLPRPTVCPDIARSPWILPETRSCENKGLGEAGLQAAVRAFMPSYFLLGPGAWSCASSPGGSGSGPGSEVGTQASSIPSSLSWRSGDQGSGLAGARGRPLGSRCPAHRVIELSVCGFGFLSLGARGRRPGPPCPPPSSSFGAGE